MINKRGLLLGGFALLMLVTSSVSAEELILEYDPDEEVQPRGYVEGYQQLFEMNEDEIAGLEQVLIPVQDDISDLDTQLQSLQLQQDRIRQVQLLMEQKILGLRQLSERMEIQQRLGDLELKGLKQKFQQISELFFQVKRQYVMEDGSVNLLQLYSSADSPADLLFQDFLLQRLQQQLSYHMEVVSQQQESSLMMLNEVRLVQRQLAEYQDRLSETGSILAQQEVYREQLLSEKQREEDFFERILEEAYEERQRISLRIQELAAGINPLAFQDFPDEEMIWPVEPLLGISAYYHDSGYRARFGMEHNAVDIPTDQLTPVIAPLAGEVVEVHDGGATGYSYLQLAHRGELSTVYGHIYSFKVEKGEIVQQGQVIALSGGAVGTKGAGRFTTGPHLHFEVLKSGTHVDPMDYLPSY